MSFSELFFNINMSFSSLLLLLQPSFRTAQSFWVQDGWKYMKIDKGLLLMYINLRIFISHHDLRTTTMPKESLLKASKWHCWTQKGGSRVELLYIHITYVGWSCFELNKHSYAVISKYKSLFIQYSKICYLAALEYYFSQTNGAQLNYSIKDQSSYM